MIQLIKFTKTNKNPRKNKKELLIPKEALSVKDKPQAKSNNIINDYRKKLDKSHSDELSFFDEFYETIKGIAKKNHQISINNLNESKNALTNLRDKAKKITELLIMMNI